MRRAHDRLLRITGISDSHQQRKRNPPSHHIRFISAVGCSSETEILTDFPDLEEDDIRACLAYAVIQLGHPVVMAAE